MPYCFRALQERVLQIEMPVSDEAAKDVGRGEGRVCGTCSSEIKSLSPPSNIFKDTYRERWASQVVRVVRNTPSNAGSAGLVPGSERLPWRRPGDPLQDSCLERSLAGYGPWGRKELEMTEAALSHADRGRCT